MGEIGELWRDLKADLRERRKKYGIDCPGCQKVQPKRIPSRLLPGQKCRVCGYRAPRPKEPDDAV